MNFAGHNYRNSRDISLKMSLYSLGVGIVEQRFHANQGWLSPSRSLKRLQFGNIEAIKLCVFLRFCTLRGHTIYEIFLPQMVNPNPIKPLELTSSLPERQGTELTLGRSNQNVQRVNNNVTP